MKHIVGIDENGLGPVLGPLVVTGISAECADPECWLAGIKDSKSLFISGNRNSFSRMEQINLSLFQAVFGRAPDSPEDFLGKIGGGNRCAEKQPLCWQGFSRRMVFSSGLTSGEAVVALDRWMQENRFFIRDIRTHISCPRRLNELFSQGYSKHLVDFLGFAEIIKKLAKEDAEIWAGKIGGMKNYLAFLRYGFPEYKTTTLQETPACSSYLLTNRHRRLKIGFHLDVEKVSVLACLSSIVGKYVRELFMESINQALGNRKRVSGYRDVRTRSFLSRILSRPDRLGVPLDCLIRKK